MAVSGLRGTKRRSSDGKQQVVEKEQDEKMNPIESIKTSQPVSQGLQKTSAETWYKRWSSFQIPGLEQAKLREHVDHFRRVDWSKTLLGPLEDWSPSLLTCIGTCLACPDPVILFYGPGLTSKRSMRFRENSNIELNLDHMSSSIQPCLRRQHRCPASRNSWASLQEILAWFPRVPRSSC